MSRDFRLDFEIGKSKNGEDETELGDADTGCAEGVDDEPRIGNPGDFGEEKPANERDEGGVVMIVLD